MEFINLVFFVFNNMAASVVLCSSGVYDRQKSLCATSEGEYDLFAISSVAFIALKFENVPYCNAGRNQFYLDD